MPPIERPWFRVYGAAVHNAKIQKLKPALFKHWFNLMCLASSNDPRGSLPPICDIAWQLRPLSDKQVGDILEELVALRLIDAVGDAFVMHDWNEWQKNRDVAPGKRDDNHANVTLTSSENHDRVEEIRSDQKLEKETEEEAEEIATLSRRRIFVLYDSYMGKPSVTPALSEQLKAAEEEYTPECIEHCFANAAASSDGRRSWSYVHSILKRHAVEGCNGRVTTHQRGNGRSGGGADASDPTGIAAWKQYQAGDN